MCFLYVCDTFSGFILECFGTCRAVIVVGNFYVFVFSEFILR